VIEGYQTTNQPIGSRDDEGHCGNNGDSSLKKVNGNGNSPGKINAPLLAVYVRYVPPIPQTTEERRGQIRLCLIDVIHQSTNGTPKTLPQVLDNSFIPPLFPREDLFGYQKVSSETRSCTNNCGNNGYCRDLTLAIEEGRRLGCRIADLLTFQCTGILYDKTANPDGNKLTVTYYKEKPKSDN